MSGSWGSYPKIYNLGHAAIGNLFLDPVVVEEKIDGSQFSFGIFDGEIKCKSKGQMIHLEAPEKMFIQAVETVQKLEPKLIDGWTYRAEYLNKPKHNVLAYDRTPRDHLIIFDINTNEQAYLSPADKQIEAARIGLECVPFFLEKSISTPEAVEELMDMTSILGGQKVEGLVFKNYHQFGRDGKALMGKHVSEAFKEIHNSDWKERHPTKGDVLEELIKRYKTPARWDKAVIHLRERGELLNEPKDIGPLMKEAHKDLLEECGDEIKEALFKWAWPKIAKSVAAGLPSWYKTKLMESQFDGKTNEEQPQQEAQATEEREATGVQAP